MPLFYHVLFAFALLSRIGDLLTTWLVSPTLKLEANPMARRLRWPFGFLTLFAALLAYCAPEACVALTTASFLVAGSNAMKIAFARAIGEDALYQMAIVNAAKGSFWPGLIARLAPVPFYLLLAAFVFYTNASSTWAYWIGYGIAAYALAITLHGTLAYIRFRKLGRQFTPTS